MHLGKLEKRKWHIANRVDGVKIVGNHPSRLSDYLHTRRDTSCTFHSHASDAHDVPVYPRTSYCHTVTSITNSAQNKVEHAAYRQKLRSAETNQAALKTCCFVSAAVTMSFDLSTTISYDVITGIDDVIADWAPCSTSRRRVPGSLTTRPARSSANTRCRICCRSFYSDATRAHTDTHRQTDRQTDRRIQRQTHADKH